MLVGLALVLEVTGRTADGQMASQAFATISYDHATWKDHIRADEGGRYLDTELTVQPKGFTWCFTAGPVRSAN